MPANGGVHFGVACFSNDILLETIDLTKVDDVIEAETFYNCLSLRVANLTGVKEVGDYAFAACSGLTYLNIPVIETIGKGAFSKYEKSSTSPQISEVTLPDTLVSLGDAAFFGCERLKEITIPSNIVKVSDYAFGNCINLTRVNLPAETIEIGKYAFINCQLLEVINLNNIRLIGEGSFSACQALTKIDLSNIEEIGEGAFAKSYSLNEVSKTMMMNLKSIAGYAFLSTALRKFDAPNLEEIGLGAFQNNESLKEFRFSNKLKKIENLAFNGCSKLENYYYEDLTTNEKTNNKVLNDYARLVDGVLYTSINGQEYQLTSVPAALNIETLDVMEGTVRIDRYAGNGNKNVTMIILPDSLKAIGNYAFYEYDNLKVVEFRSFTAPILESEYNSKVKLSESDPGYKLLHKYFDLFGYEQCYLTFINVIQLDGFYQKMMISKGMKE